MGDVRKELGLRLRELRKAAGLTQEQLAGRAKMDYKYVGALERGERNPTLFNIERIADALEVPLQDLFKAGPKRAVPSAQVDIAAMANLLRGCDPQSRKQIIRLVRIALRLTRRR